MQNLIDISESKLAQDDPRTLSLLLADKSTGGNIRWATDGYTSYGDGFAPQDQILPSRITGQYEGIVSPRVQKSRVDQRRRTKQSAEVFTPAWICCAQINMIDDDWFGVPGVMFSDANPHTGWATSPSPAKLPPHRDWKTYVDNRVMEVSCGEAPYVASRYDVSTGEPIPVERRMGMLDRKLRLVSENAADVEEFERWTLRAFEACYAFDLQGDNVLLARENLLMSLDEWHIHYDGSPAPLTLRHKVASCLAWNVFQMDGLTFTSPYATAPARQLTLDLIYDAGGQQPAAGEPVDTKIRDWRACSGGKTVAYRSLLKERRAG